MFRCETCGATVPSECRCGKAEPTTTQTTNLTVGPWTVWFDCDEQRYIVIGPEGEQSKMFERASVVAAQRDALLAALKELMDEAPPADAPYELYDRCRAAIALAESRA